MSYEGNRIAKKRGAWLKELSNAKGCNQGTDDFPMSTEHMNH